jgi:hypothetical protein
LARGDEMPAPRRVQVEFERGQRLEDVLLTFEILELGEREPALAHLPPAGAVVGALPAARSRVTLADVSVCDHGSGPRQGETRGDACGCDGRRRPLRHRGPGEQSVHDAGRDRCAPSSFLIPPPSPTLSRRGAGHGRQRLSLERIIVGGGPRPPATGRRRRFAQRSFGVGSPIG